jgi:hypothetical protein
MRRKLESSLTLAALLLCLTLVSCGQTSRPRVAKGAALKSVKVAALEGWKEAVSDTGRFRILFHGEPLVADEPVGAGFEMKSNKVKWFALYYDYQFENNDNDATVRKKYNESVEALAKKGSKLLLAKRDLTLNGRPGVEFILLGPGGGGEWAKSYMRSFMVGSRLYTLAVDDYINVSEAVEVPAEVQNFFDSFTFWE